MPPSQTQTAAVKKPQSSRDATAAAVDAPPTPTRVRTLTEVSPRLCRCRREDGTS